MGQQVLGTANTHEDAWRIVIKDLEAMHMSQPDIYPPAAIYRKIEPDDFGRFQFSEDKPFVIYSYPKQPYLASGVAHALNWRYNTEARSCFEYMPSFRRRASWDSEDEAKTEKDK